MTLADVRHILDEARETGTVKSIYFEGGEPFLYYATLVKGVQLASSMGFQVGIVSNSYWATSVEDAREWLRPFAGLIQDLSISSDLFHWDEFHSQQAKNAATAAEEMGIPMGIISIAQPETVDAASAQGQLPVGESSVMFRGRAAVKLAHKVPLHPWEQFTECPYENLQDPGRLHVDPFGTLHICQGISIGNLFQSSLSQICDHYDPAAHPITGPLLEGGPAALVNRYGLSHEPAFADACHLCCESCKTLRSRFPEVLGPDQMYGVGL
jgi:hypothetical protein